MMRKKPTLRCVFMLLLLAITYVIAIGPAAAQQSTTVQYVYDENGRLRAVISPSGVTTIFTYDAMGNIVSITQQANPLVSVSGFTPTSGAVGDTVTINGSGFSNTVGQNTVTFNGTAAAVTSATTTQIVTSVPAGATTGPITVVSQNGMATSSSAFVVRPPIVITSFTPTIGTPATPVTIVGDGFDEIEALNNEVKFNNFPALAVSATAEQIHTSVPNVATSGHISVTTANGTAVSTGDFFVPPTPYTIDNVEATGRLEFGQSKTVSVTNYGQIALLVFDGTAGQDLTLNIAGTSNYGLLTVFEPDGDQTLISFVGLPSYFIELSTLEATGTYTIMYAPWGQTDATFTLNPVTFVPGTITPGGPSVVATNATPGQNVRLTFSGTAGQQVSLLVNDTTVSGDLSIVAPDGTTLNGTYFYPIDEGVAGFLDTTTLPETGTYSVIVNPYGEEVGSTTLTMYNVVDLSTTIEGNGPPVPLTFTTPGQNARLTFNGTAGAVHVLDFSDNDIPFSYISVYNPDGSLLVAPTPVGEVGGGTLSLRSMSVTSSGGGGDSVSIPDLPETGTYTILVNPNGADIGSMTLNLIRIEDVANTITIGGPPVTVTTTLAGQNAQLTFAGTADQHVFIRFSHVTFSSSEISILLPDGTELVNRVFINSNGGAIGINNLPVTGNYTIFINPQYEETGSMTVSASATGSMEIDGPIVTEVFATQDQTAKLTFEGVEGGRASLNVQIVYEGPTDFAGASSVISSGVVSIYNPDGTLLVSAPLGQFIFPQTLPATGTYRIEITPDSGSGSLGKVRVFLSSGGGGSF